MNYTKYMRDAAALCGVPVNVWAYRALHSAAFEVHTTCHKALETAGLRNANEIAERKQEAYSKEQARATLHRDNPQWRTALDRLDNAIATHATPMRKAQPKLTSKHDCVRCGARVYGGALRCNDCTEDA